ncbi:MAG: hypothetical protein WCJ56_13015, partial [bacterium]
MRHQISLFTLVIFITSLCAFGQYGANYFVPGETVVTPHITWAKPYAQGPVKALFITTRKNQREVIELAERMQLDYSVFTVGTDKAFALSSDKDTAGRVIAGAAEKDMAQRLQMLLRDNYDVIVLGNIKFDILPQNIRRSITDAVSNGTGLIGVASGIDDIKGALKAQDMPQSVINGIPYTALPAFAGERSQDSFAKKFFQYGQVGTGRVLLLSGFTLPLTQALTPERQGSLLTSRIDY